MQNLLQDLKNKNLWTMCAVAFVVAMALTAVSIPAMERVCDASQETWRQ